MICCVMSWSQFKYAFQASETGAVNAASVFGASGEGEMQRPIVTLAFFDTFLPPAAGQDRQGTLSRISHNKKCRQRYWCTEMARTQDPPCRPEAQAEVSQMQEGEPQHPVQVSF